MYIGIDLGSRFVKIVYGAGLKNLLYKKINTIEFYKKYCKKKDSKFVLNLQKLNIKSIGINKITATGYGKNITAFKDSKKITEIEAHVYGILNLFKHKNFTLLDIGGQDTKIINIRNRKITDFSMNDKCASGSGRYIENMSNIIGIPITELGSYYKNPVNLSHTCAIFGESEVISSIVEGISIQEIAGGINYSVFKRIKKDLINYNNEKIVFTGGLAKNKALAHYIKKELGKTVVIPDNPEYTGALGCFINSKSN
ncbi:acyl-CoA dehydratase activase [bacterium]